MYSQFFGNYLFSNGHVTKEQLLPALTRQSSTSILVSTKALYSGYMSAQEIQHVIGLQQEEGKKFSEIAIKYGYLDQHQVMELLDTPSPAFLALGQILINDGVFSYEEFESILTDYRSQSEFLDLELNEENQNDFHRLVKPVLPLFLFGIFLLFQKHLFQTLENLIWNYYLTIYLVILETIFLLFHLAFVQNWLLTTVFHRM